VIKLTKDITIIIEGYIRKDWSPEKIASRLKSDKIIDLHHEIIYQYILPDKKAGGDLYNISGIRIKHTENVMVMHETV
jgi:IS30 family transposase